VNVVFTGTSPLPIATTSFDGPPIRVVNPVNTGTGYNVDPSETLWNDVLAIPGASALADRTGGWQHAEVPLVADT
jgi:hypothetical protein